MWARISDSVLSNMKYCSVSAMAKLLWFELCTVQAASDGRMIPASVVSQRAATVLVANDRAVTCESISALVSELVSARLGNSKNGLLVHNTAGFSINDFFFYHDVDEYRAKGTEKNKRQLKSRKSYESSLKSSLANDKNRQLTVDKVKAALSDVSSETSESVHYSRSVNNLPQTGGQTRPTPPSQVSEIIHDDPPSRARPSELRHNTKKYLTSVAGACAAEAKSQTEPETSEVDKPKLVQRTPSGNLLPSSLEEALKVPIQERSEMVLNCDPFQISFLRPDRWPEVVRVWNLCQTLSEGDLAPAIGKFESDKGVQRIVERYSEGATPEIFEKVVCAIKRSDWWGDGAGKGPWVLSKTVFDKGLQQLNGKKVVSADEKKRQNKLTQKSTRKSELDFVAELRAKQKKA